MALVLFDCDGTLVDGQHMVIEATKLAWHRLRLGVPTDAAVRGVIGLELVEAMGELLPPRCRVAPEGVADAYRDAYRGLRRRGVTDPVFDGIHELLESLYGADTQLGVVTGKSRVGLDAVLAANGWAAWFATLQTSDDGPGKPDPTIVHRALAETGTAPEQTVVVGDTTYDMAMAHAAGVDAIGVTWGYHEPDALRAAGARTIADTVDQLADELAAIGWQVA